MTLNECRRYMGFPDDYIFPDHKLYLNYFMLSNSIVVPVARRLLERVVYTLDSNDFITA